MSWIVVQSATEKCSNIITLNNQEILAAFHSDGIYKYLVHQDRWELFIKFPSDLSEISDSELVIDHSTTQLYVMLLDSLLIIDLKSMQFTTITLNSYDFDFDASFIIIDSQLHVIGGEYNNKHRVYNITNNIDATACVAKFTMRENAFHSSGLVHLSSQNKMLIFGGQDADRPGNSDCDGCAGVYGEEECSLDEIWSYSFDSKQWTLLDIKMPHPMQEFGIILTSDERYVIFIGGLYYYDDYEYVTDNIAYDTIYVLDMNNMQFSKSSLKAPVSGNCSGCVIGSNLENVNVINGFIRNIIQLPFEIVEIISCFYGNECIHIMQGVKHWKIEVNHILKHMKSELYTD